MARDVSFVLDPKGGEDILQKLAAPMIERSTNAVAARANSMASSMSSDPPTIEASTKVGIIKRGARAIGTVKSTGKNEHQNYVGFQALTKAKDAARPN